ncbi:capsule biosynthesis GfcC family protein [Rhodanobacter ginsengiterrae]|uniref:capsule biosynthesis GfcC family protein n=1 Tax=Rhodanobacter ginsengiterrae TaxID=2008451 RepID=UPI003CEB8C2C
MNRALCVWLMIAWSGAGVAAQVQASGAVTHAGQVELKGPARISDAALAAQPLPQAYMKGAAWLRPSLLAEQQRLKAGVLFDLGRLQQQARADGKQALAASSGALLQWIGALPVTGRQSPALLDPRAVEVNAPENHLLAAGDELYYPLRPAGIRVVGAVQQPCSLPLVALQDARLYLASCPPSQAADRDSIYVIEPDGRVFVQAVALWNRGEPQSLAPGAVIYVPLRESAARKVDATMNSDIAAFLATQVLPGPETLR